MKDHSEFINLSAVAREYLGMPGVMLVKSKADGNGTTICNATVFSLDATMIWSGDLDVNKSRGNLFGLEREIGPLFILFESDGMRVSETPTITYLKQMAQVMVDCSTIFMSEHFVEWKRLREQRKASTEGYSTE